MAMSGRLVAIGTMEAAVVFEALFVQNDFLFQNEIFSQTNFQNWIEAVSTSLFFGASCEH